MKNSVLLKQSSEKIGPIVISDLTGKLDISINMNVAHKGIADCSMKSKVTGDSIRKLSPKTNIEHTKTEYL